MKRLILLLIPLSLAACIAPQSNSSSGASSNNGGGNGTIEVQSSPVEGECRTIGYDALRSLIFEQLQLPAGAQAYGMNQTIDQFMEARKQLLGNSGADAQFDCSPIFVKAVAHLGMVVCQYLAQNPASGLGLFPNGSGDPTYAAQALTSQAITSDEFEALVTLATEMEAYPPAGSGGPFTGATPQERMEKKKRAAVCSAIFASPKTWAF